MRPQFAVPIAAAALIATACGLGGGVSPTTTTTVPTTAPPPVTTLGIPETSQTECEDVPDPADYPVGQRARAFRPCTPVTALTLQVIRAGVGRLAQAGDTVIADFTGIRSETGELFDTTYLREVPQDFVLGRGEVVDGWDQALIGIQAGAVVKLDVPAALAYANSPPGDVIQPGDALTYTIEVRAVVKPVTADEAPLDLVVATSVGATALSISDVTVGEGALVEAGDTAVVHLLLVRGDNKAVLVNTWEAGDPLQIIVAPDQSLAGIVTGVEGARVGGTRVLTMPPALAFGDQGNPELGLPAGVDLIVVAEIVGVF
jgi:peptidylprolyl isomerase